MNEVLAFGVIFTSLDRKKINSIDVQIIKFTLCIQPAMWIIWLSIALWSNLISLC